MKYKKTIEDLLNKDWKSTSEIKKQTDKKSKKSINWYTINYALESLMKDKKAEKIVSNNVTLWKKK